MPHSRPSDPRVLRTSPDTSGRSPTSRVPGAPGLARVVDLAEWRARRSAPAPSPLRITPELLAALAAMEPDGVLRPV